MWLNRLRDLKAQQRIDARLARVALGNFGDCKTVGNGVLELRIDYGPGYRVYFGRDGSEVVILLSGGDKSTQPKDIATAKDYWADYKSREEDTPMALTSDYHEELLERLSDPDYAAGYLSACAAEGQEVSPRTSQCHWRLWEA